MDLISRRRVSAFSRDLNTSTRSYNLRKVVDWHPTKSLMFKLCNCLISSTPSWFHAKCYVRKYDTYHSGGRAVRCVFFAEEQAARHHRSFGPADKKQSPDWDFVIVFSNKAYGLTVNTKGLTDNFQFNQV